jgi:hypothetical protein
LSHAAVAQAKQKILKIFVVALLCRVLSAATPSGYHLRLAEIPNLSYNQSNA